MNPQNVSIDWLSGNVPSLAPIILKLDESSPKTGSDPIDKIVIKYNRSAAVAERLEERSFLGSLFGSNKSYEYYVVDTYQHTGVSFEQRYQIYHPSYGKMLLVFKFVVHAKQGSETTLVAELVRRENPSVTLNDKIKTWVMESISQESASLFEQFNQSSDRIIQFLSQKAARTGLQLETKVSFNDDQGRSEENIRVSSKDIQVQPKAYNNFIQIGFDVVLIPDKKLGGEVLVALAYENKSEFQRLLEIWLREYLRENVTYNEVTTNLHLRVRNGIIDYWNRHLTNYNKGWLVAELALYSSDIPAANFRFEQMEVMAELRNARIPLTNTIIMNLEDPELFKNSRVDNLETWIKEKLQQAAQNVLSQVVYAELVSRIDQLGSIIKSDLDKQAQRIGYRVEYLLTSELVDRSRLNFKFEFDTEEQSFQTSLIYPVMLNVIVAGQIRSLDHEFWRSTLTPATDFVREMKKEVLRIVRQMLLRINANDFYTQFPDLVEPKLVDAIKTLLIQQFNVDPSVDISPKIENSIIVELIRALVQGQHTTRASFFSDTVVFDITFSVRSVDPNRWDLFAGRSNSSAQEIKALIGERIRIFVENMVKLKFSEVNAIRDARLFTEIYRIADEANRVVKEKMGLIIDIIDVDQIKNGISEDVTAHNIGSVRQNIIKLMDTIRSVDDEIITNITDMNDYELKFNEEKKARLTKRLEEEQFKNNRLSYQSDSEIFQISADKNDPDVPEPDDNN